MFSGGKNEWEFGIRKLLTRNEGGGVGEEEEEHGKVEMKKKW